MNACINPVTFFVSEESLYFILLEQDQDVFLHLYILCDFIKYNDWFFLHSIFNPGQPLSYHLFSHEANFNVRLKKPL